MSDGHCIKKRYRCDLEHDCADASDEMGCPKTNCSELERHWSAGRGLLQPCNHTTACILASWRCDGQNDCGDGEDEKHCEPSRKPASCDSMDGWRRCSDVSDECVPAAWFCDGDVDCTSAEDERNCSVTCSAGTCSHFQVIRRNM